MSTLILLFEFSIPTEFKESPDTFLDFLIILKKYKQSRSKINTIIDLST